MSDVITTLHRKDDPSVNIYPNVKADNIPSEIMRIADLGTYVNQLTSINITGDIDAVSMKSDVGTFTTADIGTLNVSGISDFEGNVTFGSDVEVDGTLTLNSPDSLAFKTGALDTTALNILLSNYFEGKFAGAKIILGSGEFGGDKLLTGYESLINTGLCTNFINCFAYTEVYERSEAVPSKIYLVDFPTDKALTFLGMFDRFNGEGTSDFEIVLGNGYGNCQFMFSSSNLYSHGISKVSVAEGKTFQPTVAYGMFYYNRVITSVKGIDFSKAYSFSQIFATCDKLTEIDCTGWHLSFDISITALEHDALVTLIASLDPVTTTQTLTMGSTKMALLSTEEIQVATGKGWVIA